MSRTLDTTRTSAAEVQVTRTPRTVVLEKQAEALRLLHAGCSYDQIAIELGYTNRGAAWRLVRNALRTTVNESATDYLTLSLDRLSEILQAYWATATTGKDLAAANIVLKVIEAECKLLGLVDGTSRRGKHKVPDAQPWGLVMTDAQARAWGEQHARGGGVADGRGI
jgi:hypothetical protein